MYDPLGQPDSKRVGNNLSTPLQTVNYSYNIRGWLKDINNIESLGNDLFAFRISYDKIVHPESGGMPMQFYSPLYNGNIAETYWRTSTDEVLRKYGYAYDKLNRLQGSVYIKPVSGTDPAMPVGNYNESLTYDKNGNITNLIRYGDTDGSPVIAIDDLEYTYDNGNKLLKVKDNTGNPSGFKEGVYTGDAFDYDDYGNLVEDKNKDITSIAYNHLNLPKKIELGGNRHIVYLYNALGQKVRKTVTNGSTVTRTDYQSGFHYENEVLKFFATAEGYAGFSTRGFYYVYNYTDHLGNIRLSYTKNTLAGNPPVIVEENNYYPFGLKHQGYNNISPSNNVYKYKYQGQERQDELNLNWDSFKWRNYDFAIGRFMSIDPLAEKYPYNSTYAFQENKMGLGRELEGLELVLTHGTWAKRGDRESYSMDVADYGGGSTWEKTFSENIASATGWEANSTYEYTWTGNNDTKDRIQAGDKLANHLMSDENPYKDSKHATLVGHSHGGNVNKVAKNILEQNGWTVDIINIATPQRTDHQSSNTGDGVYLNFYNTNDAVQYAGAKPKTATDGARKDSKAELNQAVETHKSWIGNSGGHSIHQDPRAQDEILKSIKSFFGL
jgi:RHS repeat-associated protein